MLEKGGSARWRCGLVASLALFAAACAGDDAGDEAPVAVLSAFPGELAATVALAEIDETVVLDGLAERRFRLGRLNGVPVVLGMTGIGIANAARTTRAVLDHFAVSGVVFSGVAGSPYRIGDVVVADEWRLDDGVGYAVDRRWLTAAEALADAAAVDFPSCLDVAPDVAPSPLCLAHQPALFVGGTGHSSGFADEPLACRDDGDDVFGCDIAGGAVAAEDAGAAVAAPAPSFTVEDMESAAVAREAAARQLPFIAFRGTSDGDGDPLGLPGFPAQFFVYYPLAAENAARAVEAFLGTLR